MSRPNFSRPKVGRRRFVQGIAAAGTVAALPQEGAAEVLSGTNFRLELAPLPINITGRPRTATAINGQIPGPILRWREGDTVTLAVTNRLPHLSSIHWHGIRTPTEMDGVPGFSFKGIAPGETFTYRFRVPRAALTGTTRMDLRSRPESTAHW